MVREKRISLGRNKKGFSLPELMVAALVMIIAFSGVILSYIRCIYLNEVSRSQTLSLLAVKSRVEMIKNTTFAQIPLVYNNITFVLPDIKGRGISYVATVNPSLLRITVSYCWKQKDGRVFGEDTDLDGILDVGEDKNGNGLIDSPVTITTFLYNT